MFDLSKINTQMDGMDDEQMLSVVEQLRANRGLLGPAIRMFAARYGAEEWADLILSPETTREQLAQLFRIVKQEKDNGPEAIRSAVIADPVTGPLVTKTYLRS